MKDDFYSVLNEAIKDLTECGFDSQKRLDSWLQKIEIAAKRSLVPEAVLQRELKAALTRTFNTLVDGKKLLRAHNGISQYTLASIKPKLRAELDRRILASADLIKLNRRKSIENVLQRFAGWSTSIPIGGTKVEDRREVSSKIRKGITGLPFEERRVIIDQGHKLTATVSDIVAVDGGAIAGRWHHVKEKSAAYSPRPEHEARDNRIFVIRDSWAMKRGLIKLAGHQYVDQITRPAQEPFCRCEYEYIYNLRDLPPEMLTAIGKAELARVQEQIARMRA